MLSISRSQESVLKLVRASPLAGELVKTQTGGSQPQNICFSGSGVTILSLAQGMLVPLVEDRL